MTDTSPPNPLTLAIVAAEFQKQADECKATQARIQQRIDRGHPMQGDDRTAAHYGKNAAYYQSRADVVQAAVPPLVPDDEDALFDAAAEALETMNALPGMRAVPAPPEPPERPDCLCRWTRYRCLLHQE